jgi:hypothetical protein
LEHTPGRPMPRTTRPRLTYVPSGRFSPTDLLIWAIIVAGFGLVLAAGLAWLTGVNGYAVGWIWILPASLLCGLAQTAVAHTLCRNRAVGLGLGLLAGVVVVCGMYHIDQCGRWGVGWDRLDRIPGYITFRMETDGWWAKDARMPLVWPFPAQAGTEPWLPPRVRWNWHWATFVGELAILVLLPAGFGWARAGRPFSERLGEWFARDAVTLTKASAAGLREGLATGTIAEWVASGVEKALTHDAHMSVAVWYCPRRDADSGAESEVYLSVGHGPLVFLEPEEAAALTAVIPGLADLAVPEAAKFESATSAAEARTDDPTVARLIQISSLHVGRAQTAAVRWRGKALVWGLMFLPWLVLFAFAGSVWLGHLLLNWLGISDEWLVIYLAGGGIALLLFIKRWHGQGGGVPFARLVRYYWNVLREEAAQRTDALFAPDDSRSIYSEVAPRRAWADLSGRRLECEGGLLLIDSEGASLLFEGDRHRYIVPMSAIVRCDVEEVTRMGTTDGLYAVVLVARIADGGTHELPIIPLGGIAGENPWEKAATLHRMIWGEMAGVGIPANDPGAENA